jgi:hypothetical protein
VFDGLWLTEWLWKRGHLGRQPNWVAGGALNDFALCARRFFDALKRCGCDAFVMFGSICEERADRQCLNMRLVATSGRRLERSGPASGSASGTVAHVLPPLAVPTLLGVLRDVQVRCTFGDGAPHLPDAALAAFARAHGCSLVTGRPNLLWFDVPAGVITDMQVR